MDTSAYIKLGWSLIRVRGKSDTNPDKSKDRSKKPLPGDDGKWERFQDELAPEDTRAQWAKAAYYGVAVVCGALSGVVVVDFDDIDSFYENESRLELLPDRANVVFTGKSGAHVYYKHPGVKTKNSVKAGEDAVGIGGMVGVDFRGDGGYAVIPPTPHYAGDRYRWATGEAPEDFPSVPDWLMADIVDDVPDTIVTTKIKEGGRDNQLTSLVGSYARHGLPYSQLLGTARMLNQSNCVPPLPDRDVMRIVDSIFSRESRSKNKKGSKNSDTENQGEPYKFPLVSFEEFYAKYGGQENHFDVEDWLPFATCGIVGAAPGSWKTWMMLDLAVSMSTGRPFLGKHKVNRTGEVIVVQQEDSYNGLLGRIAIMMGYGKWEEKDGTLIIEPASNLPPIYFHTQKELKLADERVIAGVEEMVLERRPVLFTLDPLYSATGTEDFMASAASQMLFMKKLRDETDTNFLVLHHTNKGGNGEKVARRRDKLWGAQFLNAWIETGWHTDVNEEGVVSIERHFKDDALPEMVSLKWNIRDDHYEVNEVAQDDELEIDESTEDADAAVREYLDSKEVRSLSEMCEALGIGSKSTAQRILKRVGADKINGVYKIT